MSRFRWPKSPLNRVFSLPAVDLAIPVFGYQSHISIDRGFGFIRKWAATDAAAYEGARLREGLLDKTNTASGVWADTAYRSAKNERHLADNGLRSQIHRKKPQGKPMPGAVRHANAAKSKIRAHVEHVFAEQKDRMELFIRTIGLDRAKAKIGMAIWSTTSNDCCSCAEPPRPDKRRGDQKSWPQQSATKIMCPQAKIRSLPISDRERRVDRSVQLLSVMADRCSIAFLTRCHDVKHFVLQWPLQRDCINDRAGQPNVEFLVRHQKHRHCLGVNWPHNVV
jgi:Transposase DDE domain